MSTSPTPQISGPIRPSGASGGGAPSADPLVSPATGGRHTDVLDAARRCGRCRREFPIGSDVHPMELHDWWVCPSCTDALMPTRRDRNPA
jgi:hypothetical protein